MKVYENDYGIVEKGLFTGFRFKMQSGRTLKATPFMKHLMGALHENLKRRGFDVLNDDIAKACFWDFFLDMASSPPNGLRHQAMATMPVDEHADHIQRRIEHS